MKTRTIESIQQDIDAVSKEEILVETNEGTFGSHECMAAIRTGDTARGVYRVWESVGGTRRVTGCDLAMAPGRARELNRRQIADRRKVLSDLRNELKAAKSAR